ncbi:MAG: alpha-galactosidase [Armatimonadetes bacterium]|nr:alpha-galactosidase [Armatimonadota bacterium]
MIGILMGVAILAALQLASGANITTGEIVTAHRWATAKFQGIVEKASPKSGLLVLANHDPVQRNARAGRPLNIAGTQYSRGLYYHATSKVVVRLPGPGANFTAFVGVDSNEQTSGGRGSIIFSVKANEKELFNSGIMREGNDPIAVNVPLNGSTEFTLEVSDAGDGIACDQADWADAKATMEDGSEIWLGDLPIVGNDQAQMFDSEPPFSFTYDGKLSSEFLKTWTVERKSKNLDNHKVEHTTVYRDKKTGLVVRLAAIEYKYFPIVEWIIYFKNTGSADTPIISDLKALDCLFIRSGSENFVLHHHVGSPCLPNDYQPLADILPAGAHKHIATSGGRSSNSDLPYFNIQSGFDGVIMAIGWPGQWAADFIRESEKCLRARAGQELTHFKLHPGEEVRTPLIVLQFWQGDRLRAHNIWRRWMLEHNLPKPYGKQVQPQMAGCSSHQYGEMVYADSESQKFFIDRYIEEGIQIDYWWMDAGWYVNETGWPNTGTWEVDTKRFPGGLRQISDHAHAKGVKTIVWFEPERVTPGTWIYEKHPEWLLGPDGNQKLLNLGNPEALRWLTEHVDKLIVEQGIDLYRNDFNIDPLPYWRGNDSEDRQGITEIKYVEGFLAFWDELRRRHPNMLIDTCASGGRRNDLETLRRAVPLLRSDYILEPIGQQCHTYGISFWIPFFGTGVNQFDAYSFRSAICPHITGCWDMRVKDSDYKIVRKLVEQWRKVAPYMLGDYYPLTSYSLNTDVWIAWQFDHPDLGEGMVQAFRRPASPYESARFKLHGLDPNSEYIITNLDTNQSSIKRGCDLIERGLQIFLKNQPDSAIVSYKRKSSK